YFMPSDVMFDESAANWVGSRGAIEFFSRTEGAQSGDANEARAILDSVLTVAAFLRHEDARLLDLYDSKLPSNEKIARRVEVFAQIQGDYAALKESLSGLERYDLDKQPLNNAVLINYRIYFHDQDDFEALERVHQGS